MVAWSQLHDLVPATVSEILEAYVEKIQALPLYAKLSAGALLLGLIAWLGSRRSRRRKLPPGPWGIPYLGAVHQFSKLFHEDIQRLRAVYGNVLSFKLSTSLWVVVSGYPAIKEAFVRRAEDFAGRPLFGYDELINYKDQIFFADYDAKWKANKKFAMVALKQFGYGSPRLENKVLEEISTVVDKIKEHKGEGFDLLPYMCFATARVVLPTTLIGHRQPTDAETNTICKLANDFYSSSSTSELGFAATFLPMWLVKLVYKKTIKESVQLFEDISANFQQYIVEHKATLDPDNPRDVLDLYIKRLDKDMTEEEVIDTVFLFIPDAIDTLSRLFTTALLYITYHPEVQVKIHEELDRVVGRTDPVRMEHKEKLPYLHAALLEADRITNVAPLAAPHKAVGDTTFAGYDIPKDTVMIPNLYSVHFDEDIFPNAKTFDPCHFLDENGQVKNAEYCVPFSVGRRMCMGESLAKMEKFMFAANLFQRFSFSFPPEEPNPPYDGIVLGGIFFLAKPYKICANPRS